MNKETKKLAVFIYGEFREFENAYKSWNFINEIDSDVFISTWTTSKDLHKKRYNEVVTEDRIKKCIPNIKISLEPQPDSYCNFELVKLHLKKLFDMSEQSSFNYEKIILIRSDLLIKEDVPIRDYIDEYIGNKVGGIGTIAITGNEKTIMDLFFIMEYKLYKSLFYDIVNNTESERCDPHYTLGNVFFNNKIDLEDITINKLHSVVLRSCHRNLNLTDTNELNRKYSIWNNSLKLYVCPMSKNILDVIIDINSEMIGIIPTRRQIDYNGGYVNSWNTKDFYEYVRDKSNSNIIIERDHSGANQGTIEDDGYIAHSIDQKYFDIIHIDPWKKFTNIDDGISETISNIRYIYRLNPNVKFEVGTEYSMRPITSNELRYMLNSLKENLTENEFNNIEYVVIQSKSKIDLYNKKNLDVFNKKNYKKMIDIVKKFNFMTKEHNGDFLTNEEIKHRFDLGLSSINIGPEIAQIETNIYLDHMNEEEIDNFYDVCLTSGKWKRWYDGDVNLLDKRKLIEICGHYHYNSIILPDVNEIVKEKIKNHLISRLSIFNK